MKRNIVITEEKGQFIEDRKIEMVERKGIGHPDSICDGIAERISVEYCKYCLDKFDLVLHHNFDKVQLVAGKANAKFGGGTIEKPIIIQIAGRGSKKYKTQRINLDNMVEEWAGAYLSEKMNHYNLNNFKIRSFVGEGSPDLVELFERYSKGKIPLANDTSFGVAHYPLSNLENMVLNTEIFIYGTLREKYTGIGEDVKVMGYRNNNKIDITVAIAMIDSEFSADNNKGLRQYKELKDTLRKEILEHLQKISDKNLNVNINTADDYEKKFVYITVTGTSAENGDDGAVGRGNRANGLITPYRKMSLEACAGKNPISHTGKIYNVLASIAAEDIVEKVTGVKEVTISILSEIGSPIDEPQIANAMVFLDKGVRIVDIQSDLIEIIDNNLENMNNVRDKIINREISIF